MNFSVEFANHLSILASRYDADLNVFSTMPVSDSMHLMRDDLVSDTVRVFVMFGRDVLDLALLDSEFRKIFDPNDVGVGDPHQYLGTYSNLHCFYSCHSGLRSLSMFSLDLSDLATWSTCSPSLRVVAAKSYLLK